MYLNINQTEAVNSIKGPCLILAGAGSGKTKVIISKIIYLINNCGYQSNHIAALTFTNKAAQEMKNRISEQICTTESKKIIISTFHALGMKIIRSELKTLGMKSNFSLFDEQDQIMLLKEISLKYLKENKNSLKTLLSFISNWKSKLLTPMQVLKLVKSKLERIFADCYKKYDNYLRTCNILDFDDLIFLPTLLFKNNLSARIRWQKKIRYLLVDEYQDTNEIQYELIKLLSNSDNNFTLVGDDDQSIYSWRGARPQNILLLKEDYPTLQVIKMEHNYRSSQRILKAANFLIANNPHIFKKNLFSELDYGSKIKVSITENEEHEAKKVVKKIISHHRIHHTTYNDYAILYRSNYQCRILEKILLHNHIPYHISSSFSLLSRPEIKHLISYLRFVVNPNDNNAFLKIINLPSRQIGSVTLNKLTTWAKKNKKSFFDASIDIELKKILTVRSINNLEKFIFWIQSIINLVELTPYDVLDNIVKDIKYEKWIYKNTIDPNIRTCKINNISIFSKWIKDMLKGNQTDTPLNLSQIITKFTLRDVIDNTVDNHDIDKVQLMTLHASKGLEFPVVFIIGMEEGILPHYSAIADNVDEERRLAYVGITRAKKELFFSYCKKRYQYGETLYPQPSRFLFELPQNDLIWTENIQIKNTNQLNILSLKKILKKQFF
ncbi:MAG TPA: DNA helicase Rep [Buchnera sp. (in: enterobacteria)]|nr:DNA helicase Rep [Buchnera sp. (in: enterobacteria)]